MKYEDFHQDEDQSQINIALPEYPIIACNSLFEKPM